MRPNLIPELLLGVDFTQQSLVRVHKDCGTKVQRSISALATTAGQATVSSWFCPSCRSYVDWDTTCEELRK